MKAINTITSIETEFTRAYNAALNEQPIDLMAMTASEITVFMNHVQNARSCIYDAHEYHHMDWPFCKARLDAIDRVLAELAKQYS